MSASQPSGSPPCRLRSSSAASSRKRLRVRGEAIVPVAFVARAARPAPARKCASASSGTRNGGSIGQPRFRLVAATSSSPERRAVRLEACPACRASRSRCGCGRGSATAASVSPRARLQRRVDRGEVVAVGDGCRRASRRPRSARARSSVKVMSVPADRVTRVVVVQADQLAEPQVAGQRRRFGRDAFHQVAIADDHVGVVIDRPRCPGRL